MPQLMFYENVTPLNRDQHKSLRLRKPEGDCSFATAAGFVPLAGVEFAQSALDYPILVSGTEKDLAPVALLGLTPGVNEFVEPDGRWTSGCYVPAFVRRYPFVLARADAGDTFTVCIDDRYKGFGDGEGETLFAEDGSDGPVLREAIAFMQGFLAEMERTRAFMQRLDSLELLVARDMQLTDAAGKSVLLRGFRVVDDSRLSSLDDATVLEFHRAGYWPWIHAHLVSLGNLPRLQTRASARRSV